MLLTVRRRTLFVLLLILVSVIFCAWVTWQSCQTSRLSERHTHFFTIGLSYDTAINNVTFLLPVPELNGTPVFITSLLNGTTYGISTDWNLSVVHENGTSLLAIRAARMVPEFHGYPVAIEPGAGLLPATRAPGHEYSGDTPILIPVTITVMEPGLSEINTRNPVGHEPLLFPGGNVTPGSCGTPAFDGLVYYHTAPAYVSYRSERPVSLSLRVTVEGSNAVWRGGWLSNTYSDTVAFEIPHGAQGWVDGDGELITGEGVYW